MTGLVERLDDFGKPAWITVMVLGFILFWPIGLAILAYMIWSGRMTCGRHGEMGRWRRRMARHWEEKRPRWAGFERAEGTSGNRAFDEYREETIARMETEEREFREFLTRLRMAKDRAEFDQFMNERRAKPQGAQDAKSGPEPAPSA